MFTLAISFDHFQLDLIHGPNIPGSYAILLFTASNLTSITSHIHNWVLVLLWLHLFILSGVISPLISSSINMISSSINWAPTNLGEFSFQCHIFLPFHTVHGVLKAGILKWFAKWQLIPLLLPGESHGGRSLVGYSPWGRKESDTTEQLHFHFSPVDHILSELSIMIRPSWMALHTVAHSYIELDKAVVHATRLVSFL